MLAVEHLGVEVRPDRVQRDRAGAPPVRGGAAREGDVAADAGRAAAAARGAGPPALGRRRPAPARGPDLPRSAGRALRVAGCAGPVPGRASRPGRRPRDRRRPGRSGGRRTSARGPPRRPGAGTSIPAAVRSSAVADHLVGALHQQPGEADQVRPVLPARRAISFSGGTLIPRFTTSKPLFERMISTRFLPMSWTSPLTVARSTFPAAPPPSHPAARGGPPRPSWPPRSGAPRRRSAGSR